MVKVRISGADRICMPSPNKKTYLVYTGLVHLISCKLALNKRQPQMVSCTPRQRVQTYLAKAPRLLMMLCTDSMTLDLSTRAGDSRGGKQQRTQRVRKQQTANRGGRR